MKISERVKVYKLKFRESVSKPIDKIRLERNLAGIVRTMNDHVKNKVKPGSSVYQTLDTLAKEHVAAFALSYEIDPKLVTSQLPSLAKLDALAHPKIWTTKEKLVNGVGGLLVVTVSLWLIGVGSGIIHELVVHGYKLVLHVF